MCIIMYTHICYLNGRRPTVDISSSDDSHNFALASGDNSSHQKMMIMIIVIDVDVAQSQNPHEHGTLTEKLGKC